MGAPDRLPPETVGAVIVAAGRSTRMDGIDKIFAPLGSRPLIAHSLDVFERADAVDRIVLVVAPENVERAGDLVRTYAFRKVAAVVPGGERRQDSVRAGLDALGPCDWVLIHDGARPLVEPRLISEGLATARMVEAAVAAVPVVDTVKEVDTGGLVRGTPDRSRLWAVQTPQVFSCALIRRAHREISRDVTDDAAMVELLGNPVMVYRGSYRNIKVTTPADLAVAEALLKTEQSS